MDRDAGRRLGARDVPGDRTALRMMPALRFCPLSGHPLEMRRVDGVDRLACRAPGCGFVHWDNPVPVVAGLVVHDHHIVLARDRRWPADRFSMITGYLERHESPEQAVRRELREELGLEACAVDFIGHYPVRDKNQLLIAFALDAHGDLNLGDEIAATRRVSRQALADYDFGPFQTTRAIVHDWLGRSPPSVLGTGLPEQR